MPQSLQPSSRTEAPRPEVKPAHVDALESQKKSVSDQLIGAAWAASTSAQHVGLNRKTQTIELSIVVPMFNEAARIEKSIDKLVSSSLNRTGVEFVFVDDGSSDDTLITVARAIKHRGFVHQPRIESLGRNRGKGAAVRAGIISTLPRNSPYAAFIDADLSLNPEVLDTMLERLRSEHADMIVGQRVVNLERQPKLRRLMSLTFTSLTQRLAPTGVQDTQCACKIFTAETVRKIVQPMVTEGFAFDVEILLRAQALNLVVVEHPVHWRHSEGSSVNQFTAPIMMIRDVLRARRMIKTLR